MGFRSRVLLFWLRSRPLRWLLLRTLHRSGSLFLHPRLRRGCLSFRRRLRMLLRCLSFRRRLLTLRPLRWCWMLLLLRLHRCRPLPLISRLRRWRVPFGSGLRVLLRRWLLLPRSRLLPHPGLIRCGLIRSRWLVHPRLRLRCGLARPAVGYGARPVHRNRRRGMDVVIRRQRSRNSHVLRASMIRAGEVAAVALGRLNLL